MQSPTHDIGRSTRFQSVTQQSLAKNSTMCNWVPTATTFPLQ